MSEKKDHIRIKDIAELSGVSEGTVDRVLHNRGKVSEENRKKVEKVLQEVKYRPNIYASALAHKKSINICALIPTYAEKSYWEQVYGGMTRFTNENQHLHINLTVYNFDQYDQNSFTKALEMISKSDINGLIFPPFFAEQTLQYSHILRSKAIPFVFIDSNVPEANPLCYYGQDSFKSGQLIGRLLSRFYHNCDILVLNFLGSKGSISNQSQLRYEGIASFLEKHPNDITLKTKILISGDNDYNRKTLRQYFCDNKNTKSIVTLNSLASLVCEYLEQIGENDRVVMGYDLTPSNVEWLKKGRIEVLVGQRPEQQGYNTVKSLSNHILFRMSVSQINHIPIDIYIPENIDFCKSDL